MLYMTSREDHQTDASHCAAAIARWDDEGGAPVSARNKTGAISNDVGSNWMAESPADLKVEDSDKFAAVQNDFNTPKRQNDALIRTVVSPDGRRVLALYGTEDEPGSAFRIDLYSSDGQFIRNMIPPAISCVFRRR